MINNKIMNIAIYGSCISKDPFTTIFNKNYKENFDAVINDQRHSFISTMQEKKKVSDEDITILPQISNNKFETQCIKEDFEKKFIDDILSTEIDYLIFDIHFEVENGVLNYGNDEYITNFDKLDQTPLYDKLSNKKAITAYNNFDEFFNLWKEYCDKFFTFMKENSPETGIILAEVRALDTVKTDDFTYKIEDEFSEKAKNNNRYYRKLEKYIKDNYDVYVVSFDKDTVLKDNHRWGKHYLHYNDEYYPNFLEKVIHIIQYDQLKRKQSQYEQKIQKLKENLRKSSDELTKDMLSNIDELKKSNNNLANEIRKLNNELKRANNELNNANFELNRINRESEKLYEENKRLKQRNH